MAEAKKSFYFDLVVCIDKTFNMYDQVDFIINFLNSFYDMAKAEIQNSITKLEQLRIKVITYGDYNVQNDAVTDYGFLTMPEQSAELYNILENLNTDVFVKKQNHSSGLEALSYAIDSEFVDLTNKSGRHAIVIFSKNKPLSLEESRNLDNFPSDLPNNLLELKNKWDANLKTDKTKKMLTLFCDMQKEKDSWYPIERWDRVMAIGTEDLNEYTSDFILETILIDII